MATGTPRHTWTDYSTPITAVKLNELEQDVADGMATANEAHAVATSNTYSTEQAQDAAAALFTTGTHTGISFAYNDAGNALNASVTASGYTDEQVRDVVGATLVAGSNVTITPADGSDTITIASTGGGGGGSSTAVNVKDAPYSAQGNGRYVSVTTTAGSTTLTGTGFTSADTGRTIMVPKAGSTSAVMLIATVTYVSSTQLTLSTAAGTAASGALATLGTDDTAALQAALTAVPDQGGAVYVPAGIYVVPSGGLNCDATVRFFGDPGLDGTGTIIQIGADAVTGLTFSASGSVLENFDVERTVVSGLTRSASLVGLRVTVVDFTRLDGVRVAGFGTNAQVDTGIYYSVLNCSFRDFANVGLRLYNPNAGGDAGDSTVHNCTFDRTSDDTTPGGTCVLWTSGGGLRFQNNKINGPAAARFLNGISFAPTSGVGTAVLKVENNSIEGFTGVGVGVLDSGGAILHTIMVVGNEIAGYDTTTTTGVLIEQDAQGVVLAANSMRSLAYAFDVNYGQCVSISGNTFTNVVSGGIRVRQFAKNVTLGPQAFAMAANGYAIQFDDPLRVAEARHTQTFAFNAISNTVDNPLVRINLQQFLLVVLEVEVVGLNQGAGSFYQKLTRTATAGSSAVTVATIGTDITSGTAVTVNFDDTTPLSVAIGVQRSVGTNFTGQLRVTASGNGLYQAVPLVSP